MRRCLLCGRDETHSHRQCIDRVLNADCDNARPAEEVFAEIEREPFDPHWHGWAECRVCTHRYVVVAPLGVDHDMQCPNCECMTSDRVEDVT